MKTPPTKEEKKPNPGSKEALLLGCECPTIDNHYGKGFLMGGEISFWQVEQCPLHGLKPNHNE